MHAAAEGGQLEMVKYLSANFGAAAHDKDVNGKTMLHWAAVKGHCAVVQYLIKELKLDPQDRDEVCACLCEWCV